MIFNLRRHSLHIVIQRIRDVVCYRTRRGKEIKGIYIFIPEPKLLYTSIRHQLSWFQYWLCMFFCVEIIYLFKPTSLKLLYTYQVINQSSCILHLVFFIRFNVFRLKSTIDWLYDLVSKPFLN